MKVSAKDNPKEGTRVRKLKSETYVKYSDSSKLSALLKRRGCPHYIENGHIDQFEIVDGKEKHLLRESQYRSFFTFTSTKPSKRLTKDQFFWFLVDNMFVENPYNLSILNKIIANNYTINDEIQSDIDNLLKDE